MKSFFLLCLGLIFSSVAFGQSVQERIERPKDVLDRGINQYVGEVFSAYDVTRALSFDLTQLEDQVAMLETDPQRTARAVEGAQNRLEAFNETFSKLTTYREQLVEKMPVVQEAAERLQPENQVTLAQNNLSVCSQVLTQLEATLKSKTDEITALSNRVNNL